MKKLSICVALATLAMAGTVSAQGYPTRPITSFKTAWIKVRLKAGVKGRWHDNRHTLVTELAESGAGDHTGYRPR